MHWMPLFWTLCDSRAQRLALGSKGFGTWGITYPKVLMHLENLSSNICWHTAGARRKCVLFCLACTWAWTTASAGLGQEMFAAWAMDGMRGARVTEQQNNLPSWFDAPSTDLVVGVTLEICKIKIWPLGCREVFTNVKDIVPGYLLSSRRYKLGLYHASWCNLVQFPVEIMNLIHPAVPEKLLHLTFVATTFWWKNAKYVPWGSLQIKMSWKFILYIRFIGIPADRIADKWSLRRWKLVNAHFYLPRICPGCLQS